MISDLSPHAWMGQAICAQVDPDFFFPDEHNSGDAAKKICARCPVIEECRRYGIENAFEYGIYGGLNYRARRAYRKRAAA